MLFSTERMWLLSLIITCSVIQTISSDPDDTDSFHDESSSNEDTSGPYNPDVMTPTPRQHDVSSQLESQSGVTNVPSHKPEVVGDDSEISTKKTESPVLERTQGTTAQIISKTTSRSEQQDLSTSSTYEQQDLSTSAPPAHKLTTSSLTSVVVTVRGAVVGSGTRDDIVLYVIIGMLSGVVLIAVLAAVFCTIKYKQRLAEKKTRLHIWSNSPIYPPRQPNVYEEPAILVNENTHSHVMNGDVTPSNPKQTNGVLVSESHRDGYLVPMNQRYDVINNNLEHTYLELVEEEMVNSPTP